ncbi:fanconi-associated nuclease 1-like isoform X2 [Dermacentor albipictus]|uniref:fanconi-associated nuclease 1-like isoform X2 n=1 Tax=Dermacentor albipictus TaxID=60249 RepID=UPI0031FC5204
MSGGQSKITSFFVSSSPTKTSAGGPVKSSPRSTRRGGKLSLKNKATRLREHGQSKKIKLDCYRLASPPDEHDSDVEIVEIVPSQQSSSELGSLKITKKILKKGLCKKVMAEEENFESSICHINEQSTSTERKGCCDKECRVSKLPVHTPLSAVKESASDDGVSNKTGDFKQDHQKEGAVIEHQKYCDTECRELKPTVQTLLSPVKKLANALGVPVRPSGFKQSVQKEVEEENMQYKQLDSTVRSSSSPLEESADGSATRSPYYLENLVLIVNSVKGSDDWNLFNQQEQDMFCEFLEADDKCQKLLARLLQRKHMWRRTSKIGYPDIASDVSPILFTLRDKGYIEDAASLKDLDVALHLLSPFELKTLAQVFKLRTSGQGKGSLADSLLDHCNKQQTVLFGSKQASLQQLALKRALALLGPAWRLCDEPRNAWRRLLRLFSLGTPWDIDEAGETPQVYGLQLVAAGKMAFPEYEVSRQHTIFPSRLDLVRYEASRVLEAELIQATTDKKWDRAKQLFNDVEKLARSTEALECQKRDQSLAPFLRHFSMCGVYTRCRCLGVDVLQRLKEHRHAVKVLRELLSQELYCQSRRGHWWDRLALNLEVHLGKPAEALKVVHEALDDSGISPAARHALVTRANRLVARMPKNVLPSLKSLLEQEKWDALPQVEIEGQLAERMVPGRTNLFAARDGTTMEVISVEEVALRNYNLQGYPKGVHGEGSTFHALFGLLCWDVIYMSGVPDAFRSAYQALPLDLHSNCFFRNREQHFLEAFKVISESTTPELEEKVAAAYTAHFGKAGLVQWDRFTCTDVQEIVRCLGPHVLSRVCELLARQFRHRRSGLPDLLVWNPETDKAKAAEVKGPGDTLSPKQVVWLRELLALGVDCEVCRVTGLEICKSCPNTNKLKKVAEEEDWS